MRLVPWGQGFKDMGAGHRRARARDHRALAHASEQPAAELEHRQRDRDHGPGGNRKLDKGKARFRIDGAVALAMLLGLRARDRTVKPVDIEALIG